MTASPPPKVVLIHGLFMRPLVMRPLAYMLRKHGFTPLLYGYSSTKCSVEENSKKFAEWLGNLSGPVHVVGHSLGAVITLQALAALPNFSTGRIVALTPPFRGSVVGVALAKSTLGRLMLGECEKWWQQPEALHTPIGWEVGVIAGSKSFGAGRLFSNFSEPNDGTVSVSETKLEGATASLCLPVTHTGVIYSPLVASHIARFLSTGRFNL